MPLEGNLRDFALSDIFQLISQQKKSGKLIISSQDNRGVILFCDGNIVSAQTRKIRLQNMIAKYLVKVKNYSPDEINEILSYCKWNLRNFVNELVTKKYIFSRELCSFVTMMLEDIICDFFIWPEGDYSFESFPIAELQTIDGVSVPIDSITMEAMRRIDEWKKMRQFINEATIFAAKGAPLNFDVPTNDFTDTTVEALVYSLVDGNTPIRELSNKSFFLQYRIYETLFKLWEKNAIKPVTYRLRELLTEPPNTTISHRYKNLVLYAISITFALASMAMVFIIGYLFFHQNFLANKRIIQSQSRIAIPIMFAQQKHKIARFYIRTENPLISKDNEAAMVSTILSSKERYFIRQQQPQASDKK